jgi:tRNA (guanine-N7-)-methyltransferase
LKTDSPDLYDFTKTVIRLYGCTLLKDHENLYADETITDELKIKTHYESLDIAQSNRIHYIRFSLPRELPDKEVDEELKQVLKDEG